MLINIIPFHWWFAVETAVKSDFLLSYFLHMSLSLNCADSQCILSLSISSAYWEQSYGDARYFASGLISSRVSSLPSLSSPLRFAQKPDCLLGTLFCSIDHLNQILQRLLLKLSPAQAFLWSVDIWGSDKKTVKGMKLFLEVPSHLPYPSQEWKEIDVMSVPSTWQWPDMWCSMSVLKWGILRRLLTNHKAGEEEKGILEKAYKVQDGGLRHKQLRCLLSTGSRNSHLALNPG